MANDEQVLRQIVAQLEAAWNNSDSIAFAAPFAEDADFIHILGGQFVGRIAIEKGHRAIFDTVYKNSKLKWDVQKIRFAGPDVAIVFASGTLTTSHPGIPPQINARPTIVAHKRDGRWQIITFQNTRILSEGGAAAGDAPADQNLTKSLNRVLEQ